MNLRALLALAAAACLLIACPPGGGGGGDAGPDGGSDAPTSDGSPDSSTSVAEGGSTDAASSDGTVDGPSSDSGTAGADGGTDGPLEAGEAGVVCTFDAGTAPDGGPVCGDGWRDPTTEECDDGLGASTTARRGCSAQCQVLDELAVAPMVVDAGPSSVSRTLGAGRHPVAASDSTLGAVYLETSGAPPTLSLVTFSAKGVATGVVNQFSAQSTVVDNSNPVVAGLPCGRYAVAWADYDTVSGDELDVAIRIVDPSMPVTSPPAHANTTMAFSQFDPDVLWTGSELVVAWVDDSNPVTQPDLRFRTFDANFNPTSAEQTLAGTADSEADVALAPFGGSWAAAWRDDANGLETIHVQAGGATWTVGPAFLPGPAGVKPALAALDATHLLVAFAVGVDDTDSGVASGSQLRVAVLDTAIPGPVSGMPVPAQVSSAALDQSQPNLANVQGVSFLTWWTTGATGDPNGEELWLKSFSWSGSSLDLSTPEVPLPRWPQARVGDQRSPGLATSSLPAGGALVAGWDDLGRHLGTGEGNGDVVIELIPVPMLRTPGDGGP